jgi:SNF2 family DNA or RNA helicase
MDVVERNKIVQNLLSKQLSPSDKRFVESIAQFESWVDFSEKQKLVFYIIWRKYTNQTRFVLSNRLHAEFRDNLSLISHVVRKEDALDLPDQVHEKRIVELSKPEQAAYDQLKNDLVLRFADETILATSALVECMKLRQLTSGFCYGVGGVHQTGKSKLTELKELLEEIGKNNQIIIWANFRAEISTIQAELGDCGALWSETKDRNQVISDFQAKKTKYLVSNPQSAAHGLTFTNCNYAVYYSLNYSYEMQKQSQDRIHRIGQKNKVTYFYLLAKNSIDEIIYKAVNHKAALNTEVLSYLKNRKETDVLLQPQHA